MSYKEDVQITIGNSYVPYLVGAIKFYVNQSIPELLIDETISEEEAVDEIYFLTELVEELTSKMNPN